MTDDIDRSFDWHAAALKGTRGTIDADNPKSGFYRTRAARGSKDFIPVAFWYDSNTGDLRCHRNGKNVDELLARELWPYASKNPVSAEAYWAKRDTGQWPDNDATAAVVADGPEIDPAADPVGSLKAEIDKALTGVSAYKAIESDEQAARGQTLRSALTTLSGTADKKRIAEKEPHLQASRDVDAKWQPLVKSAKQGADDIRTALGKWEDTKREALRAAQAEADRKAREHADAVRAAEVANQPPPPPLAAPVVPNTPAPSTQIKGASGRTAHVGVKRVVVAIDLQKAWEQFGGQPEVYEFLLNLAQKAIDAGIETPCATVEEKSAIR